jgi:hypothetical protein
MAAGPVTIDASDLLSANEIASLGIGFGRCTDFFSSPLVGPQVGRSRKGHSGQIKGLLVLKGSLRGPHGALDFVINAGGVFDRHEFRC